MTRPFYVAKPSLQLRLLALFCCLLGPVLPGISGTALAEDTAVAQVEAEPVASESEEAALAQPEAIAEESEETEETEETVVAQAEPVWIEKSIPSSEGAELIDTAETSDSVTLVESEEVSLPLSLGYYSIFYGPGLKDSNGYQPGPNGRTIDPDRPVQTKNFLAVGYRVAEDVSIGAVGYWLLRPTYKEHFVMKDPYLKLSTESLVEAGAFKLYADVRSHLPVSAESRNADLKAAVQTVQIASYDLPESRWAFYLSGSARYNFFGGKGYGNDLELYLGPSVLYQLATNVALSVLYEMGASHIYGDNMGVLINDGTDLEPGVSWDVTPNLNLNPYLHIYTGGNVSWETTSIGMTLSWKLL